MIEKRIVLDEKTALSLVEAMRIASDGKRVAFITKFEETLRIFSLAETHSRCAALRGFITGYGEHWILFKGGGRVVIYSEVNLQNENRVASLKAYSKVTYDHLCSKWAHRVNYAFWS